MKTIQYLLLLSFVLLFSFNLQAQYPKAFAIEASVGGGYGHHNLRFAPLLELAGTGLSQSVKGQPYVFVGVGMNKRLNKRLDFHLGLHALKGAFRTEIEGFVLGTDIKNNFDNPGRTTLESDFNYWNVELSIWVDLHLSDHVLLSLGGGMMINATMDQRSQLVSSVSGSTTVIGSMYDLERLSSFALIGLGFPFFINESKHRIIPRLMAQYFFVDGNIEGFGPVNRILQAGASVAFEF